MAVWVPFAVMGGLQLAAGGYNAYQASKIKPSAELNQEIDRLRSRNYFTPMLQRIYSSNQADATTQKALARTGQGNNFYLQRETQEANMASAGENVRQGMGQLEGQRASLLANLLGQKNQIMMARRGAQASAVGDTVSGLGMTLASGFQYNQQMQDMEAQRAFMSKMQYQPATMVPTSMPQYQMNQPWGRSIFSGFGANVFNRSRQQGPMFFSNPEYHRFNAVTGEFE